MRRKKLQKSGAGATVWALAAVEPRSGHARNESTLPRNPLAGLQNSHEITNAPMRTKWQQQQDKACSKARAAVLALSSAKYHVGDVAWLYRETLLQLEQYKRRVDEGNDLEAAHTFCQYLFTSGIEKLLIANASAACVDSEGLARKRKELHSQIRDMWARCKVVRTYNEGHVEALNRKVDELTAQVAKLVRRNQPRNVIQIGQGT